MRLAKTDALFLYKVLYHYSTLASDMSADDCDALDDFTDKLSSFLTSDSSAEEETNPEEDESDSPEDEEDHEESDDNEEQEDSEDIEADVDVDVESLTNLPHATVTTSDGAKVTLEFDFSNQDEFVDALLDGGSTILEGVDFVKLTDNTIELHADDEWHTYTFKRKAPSTWSRLLHLGKVYAVISEDSR